MSNIVKINAVVSSAGTLPLQQKVAIVTKGGSNKAIGSLTPIYSRDDAKAALADSIAIKTLQQIRTPVSSALQVNALVTAMSTVTATISAIAWSAGVLTITTAAAHGFPAASTLDLTIAGCSPDAINGTYQATVTTTTAFTIPMALNPGALVTPGTVSAATATAIAHGLPVGKTIYAYFGNTPSSKYEGERKVFVFDANTLWLSQGGGGGSFTGLTATYVNTIALTITHGLIVGSTFKAATSGFVPTSLNSVAKNVAAPTATAMYISSIQLAGDINTSAGAYVTVWKIETFNNHGFAANTYQQINITGAVPNVFNGLRNSASIINTTTIYAYPKGSANLGAATTLGKLTDADSVQLDAALSTWFDQNDGRQLSRPVFILELGNGTVAQTLTALGAWIANNQKQIYIFVMPTEMSVTATANFARGYQAVDSMTYFFLTIPSVASAATFDGIKSILCVSESPSKNINELAVSAVAYAASNFQPTARKNSQLNFSYVYGLTPFVLTELAKKQYTDANISIIDTGVEGGDTNLMLLGGETMDGDPLYNRDFSFWRSVDYVDMRIKMRLAAEVISGSNSATNPLWYNQNGIDRLQNVAQDEVRSAFNYDVIAVESKVNAVPFLEYKTAHPDAYQIKDYQGLSVSLTPSKAIDSLVINISYSDAV